jgi:chromate transport protein ChrA
VLHTFLLIIAGLILTGVLSAILENLAFQNHPYAARILGGIGVIIAAWTHSWVRLTVIVAVAMLYVAVRRDFDQRKNRSQKLEG